VRWMTRQATSARPYLQEMSDLERRSAAFRAGPRGDDDDIDVVTLDDSAGAGGGAGGSEVGPSRYSSPRLLSPLKSRNEGSKRIV
jgi:hypothetical protein